MKVLGVTGGFDRADDLLGVRTGIHDASATLLVDGEVVAAVEEERLNRCKHTGKMPLYSIAYCLSEASIELGDLDKIVFNMLERDIDLSLLNSYKNNPRFGYRLGRQQIQRILKREFACEFDPMKFEFIDHHYAHAVSAFLPSGFSESLVVTLDGVGAGLSGSVWEGAGNTLTNLRNYTGNVEKTSQSLGHFYAAVTIHLGFGNFDEYKVMGLAPYGNRNRFRSLFEQFYELKGEGKYDILLERIEMLKDICPRRKKEEPIVQVHKDIAAAVQEALEILEFHVLEYFKSVTGADRLCLSGGVAHNCAANGKILYSRLFKDVYVQPASHDGGLSLGAALHGYFMSDGNEAQRYTPSKHVYLGPSCGSDDETEQELERWRSLVDFERVESIEAVTAELLSQGKVVGWVQGRSEFGPRALGNRSILADPRPAENKRIINAMIKMREGFRPFAPSVLEECAAEYFELPDGSCTFPYMVYVLNVQEQYRGVLGAVTHVDGSARVHTVSRNTNDRYWRLIDAFRERTGIPILLNTSFNNNVEPIVESARDALICYLTTDLHVLVIGNYLIRKKVCPTPELLSFRIKPCDYVRVHQLHAQGTNGHDLTQSKKEPYFQELFHSLYFEEPDKAYFVSTTRDEKKTEVSERMARILAKADGFRSLRELCVDTGSDSPEELLEETNGLWRKRLIHLTPG